ncbi:MAG TPA: MFS transporter [Caldimonas sp.]|nr:MFS transporter [Caldimonas sp.]
MASPADASRTIAVGRVRTALALVVVAQWLGTSLWFSPAGAADGLMARLSIGTAAFGWLIAATQLGFIAGTIGFAATGTADRFAASRIFTVSCIVGATANAALVLPGVDFASAWAIRFVVGLSLAGIYPLGMKMIVQWVGARPAAALGWLVGMLTLGTAMPHGVRASDAAWPWQAVVLASSAFAIVGAAVVHALGDGPHGAQPRARTDVAAGIHGVRAAFAVPAFRASAFGYFGHMWELYAFWSVVPWLAAPVVQELARSRGAAPTVALVSFVVIAAGAFGCIAGGQWSRRIGSARVAALALAGSGAMCIAYPFLADAAPAVRIVALVFWGVCVVADSPQFSAMSAENSPPEWLGSALVAQNGIGFAITVVSIVVLAHALVAWGVAAVWLLAPGPVLGLIALRPLLVRRSDVAEQRS